MTELITLPNGLSVEAPNRGEAATSTRRSSTATPTFSTASTCQTAHGVRRRSEHRALRGCAGAAATQAEVPPLRVRTVDVRHPGAQRAAPPGVCRRRASPGRPRRPLGAGDAGAQPQWSLDAGIDTQSFARDARRRGGPLRLGVRLRPRRGTSGRHLTARGPTPQAGAAQAAAGPIAAGRRLPRRLDEYPAREVQRECAMNPEREGAAGA